MKEVIELSWQTQAVIVGGYLAYVVSYSGRRSTHRTLDAILIILCFGSLGLMSMAFLTKKIPDSFQYKDLCLGISAVGCSLFGAILWRLKIRDLAIGFAKKLSKSDEDGLSTAWETVTQTQSLTYSQINVLTKDGKTLESYLMGDFNDLPNGPCVLGGDGSIAMYVTHITDSDGSRREAKNLQDDDGARMTLIPADQIAEVDFRRAPKSKQTELTCFRRFFRR